MTQAAELTRLPSMKPMLLSEQALPIGQGGWAYEVKWDGHRSIAYCDGRSPTQIMSRAGNNVTARYPELSVGIGEMLDGIDAIIDGEIICLDQLGRPSLRLLNNRTFPYTDNLRPSRTAAMFVAFDILWYRSTELTGWSYESRRKVLATLPLTQPLVTIPPAWEDGEEAMRYTKESGLEGVVAKRLTSAYACGLRSPNWIKHRHRPFESVV